YAEARARFGEVPTILERDDRIPPIAELMDEVARCEDAGARGQALAGAEAPTPRPSLVPSLQPHAPPLAHLERWLRWSFTDPRGVAGALANEPGPTRAQEPEPRALHAIAEGPPASREERLSVYAEAYFVRLVEALSSDFPAVKRAVGAAEFHSLVAHYLMRHQSRSPSLANLGEQFPAFLAQHEPAQRWPFLPDLARLEVAVLRGLLTDRSPRTLPAPGEDADWASARLTLDQTATLLRCAWPVLTLWRERHLETTPMLPTKKRSSHLLVHRDDVWVRVRALSQTQHALLSSLHQGESLEDACAPLAETSRAPIGTWFAPWIAAGIIRGLKPRQPARTG
ncbi:MAG: DUF692 family protein, partial [Deltaproteobacteria bacterium]|nr:DUF692 family protein [Deltaproteobacteria bacterium]